jgi:hypothetical protein
MPEDIKATAATGFVEQIYSDATETIRHYDKERAGFAKIIIGVTGVLLAFCGGLIKEGGSFVVIESCLAFNVCLSLFAIAVSIKYRDLIQQQRDRANGAISALIKLGHSKEIEVASKHTSSVHLSALWLSLFVIIALINVIIAVIIIVK